MEEKELIFRLHITGRYFEDCEINGEQDNDLTSETTPNVCGFDKEKEEVIWDIDVKTGKIHNWNGQVVDTHYKLVDEGVYELVLGEKVISTKDYCYVPGFLGIEDSSYGDYVCLHVDSDGQIRDWVKEGCPEGVSEFFGAITSEEDLDIDDDPYYDNDEKTDFRDRIVISNSGCAKTVKELIIEFLNN